MTDTDDAGACDRHVPDAVADGRAPHVFVEQGRAPEHPGCVVIVCSACGRRELRERVA